MVVQQDGLEKIYIRITIFMHNKKYLKKQAKDEIVWYQSLSGGSRERTSCMMRVRNSSGSTHKIKFKKVILQTYLTTRRSFTDIIMYILLKQSETVLNSATV